MMNHAILSHLLCRLGRDEMMLKTIKCLEMHVFD